MYSDEVMSLSVGKLPKLEPCKERAAATLVPGDISKTHRNIEYHSVDPDKQYAAV
jgi:hypothetical protein